MPTELPQFVPPGSVLDDPERRRRLEEAELRAAKITAIATAISATIPGKVGAVVAGLVVGAEKQPGTGKVAPGPGFPLNFGPSPLGFAEPAAFGLKPNWWLPDGATGYIPRVADRAGLGLPEQRAEDAARAAQVAANVDTSRRRTADAELAGESNETLEALAAGKGGFNRAGVLRATSGAESTAVLQESAAAELARRRAAAGAAEGRAAPALASAAGAAPDELIEAPRGQSVPTGQEAALKRMDRINGLNPPDP